MKKRSAAQEMVPGIQTFRPLGLGFSELGLFHFRLDRTDDLASDFILQSKNIIKCTVEFLRPEVMPRFRIDQLCRNTHTIAAFSNAAFDDITGRKLAPDCAYVTRLLPKCETRIACNNRKGSPR